MKKELLKKSLDFCLKYKMAETTFGRKAAGNAHFIKRIRSGKSFLFSTAEKVQKFMRDYEKKELDRKKNDQR